MKRSFTGAVAVILSLAACGVVLAQTNTAPKAESGKLSMYWSDTEGGAATLLVCMAGPVKAVAVPGLSTNDCIRTLACPSPAAHRLNVSLNDMRHTKLVGDLAQIPLHASLVLHHGSPADDFQIGDVRQISENFVLDGIGEECVVGIRT